MLDSVAVACGDLLQNCGAVMLQGILQQCTSASVTGIVSILCCMGRDSSLSQQSREFGPSA